ncbi:stage II sporulation protein R [Paenibacillus filicis]|uniref:Stage II sporulation protein R n=1 Tax=Paenibacillus gyeongsangnamensis TaxID=3388067 RepID=A0ABT4QDE0_9BACL|nr:stage II sporulation protein R [Paenibacillus filicis]MCZ8514807.1 stage II sporulation protein R [Paenibacillus filicis]
MVKRFAWRRYAYVGFAVLILLVCWESNRTNELLYAAAAEANVNGPAIPQDAIRMRILANSDAPMDQWIKREVRDAIMEEMKTWVADPQGIEAARDAITAHLPEIEAVVSRTLKMNRFEYGYKVELGDVPFPDKMYGNRLYPAGKYEALRVSLGKAEGQNWWCVLFPPLCFVDSGLIAKKKTTATAYAEPAPAKAASEAKNDKAAKSGKAAASDKPAAEQGKSAGAAQAHGKSAAAQDKSASLAAEEKKTGAPQPEIHFFLWDLLKSIFA